MTFRLGLVSDVHSSPAPLREALERFRREGVDEIVCAGDIAGYFETLRPTVDLLREYRCASIAGNHDRDWLETAGDDADPVVRDYLAGLPASLEFERRGKRILVVHAEPPDRLTGGIRLLDPQGEVKPERRAHWDAALAGLEHDLLIVGHTHQVYAETLGGVFVVNPGSSVFNHSCMILSLPELEVETLALGGRNIVRCWNFGMLARSPAG